ncbi:helicase associated domain-containing protein [Streptomyces sp. NPDC051956]|uniref:helicase associated domain-containing protein n=1 Tax=Streptomyces sp. NPDC051956 TaxID=3365677 RepID=UPI0037CCEB21
MHGHLLAPVSAVGEGGFPVGVWLKNQRAAPRPARPSRLLSRTNRASHSLPEAEALLRAGRTLWMRSILVGALRGTPRGKGLEDKIPVHGSVRDQFRRSWSIGCRAAVRRWPSYADGMVIDRGTARLLFSCSSGQPGAVP